MNIERFTFKRVIPLVIWSDIGTYFLAREKELLSNILNKNRHVLTESPVAKTYRMEFQPQVVFGTTDATVWACRPID